MKAGGLLSVHQWFPMNFFCAEQGCDGVHYTEGAWSFKLFYFVNLMHSVCLLFSQWFLLLVRAFGGIQPG